MEHLKYPIGKFDFDKGVKDSEIPGLIKEVESLPGNLRNVIATLTPEQLETPYRPGGWKVKQVVHHLADSHMNALIRFQLALTENAPVIKPYNENLWANLKYQENLNLNSSLDLLTQIHNRFVAILYSMTVADFDRT